MLCCESGTSGENIGDQAELLGDKHVDFLGENTSNLWVEAGLINGSWGRVHGYVWEEGGDPHNKEEIDKQAPLCVVVEFENINLKPNTES